MNSAEWDLVEFGLCVLGRCRAGSEVLLHRALAGWPGELLGVEGATFPPFSECPFAVLLHDVLGFWDSFLQKVTGTPDTMGHDHFVISQWRG